MPVKDDLKKLADNVRKLFVYLYTHAILFHGAAWTASNKPIDMFLQEQDAVKRELLTKGWCANMMSQLNTILITVYLHNEFILH